MRRNAQTTLLGQARAVSLLGVRRHAEILHALAGATPRRRPLAMKASTPLPTWVGRGVAGYQVPAPPTLSAAAQDLTHIDPLRTRPYEFRCAAAAGALFESVGARPADTDPLTLLSVPRCRLA